MMTDAEIEQTAEALLACHLTGQGRAGLDILQRVLAGPRGDSRALAMYYARQLADKLPAPRPGEDFHRLEVIALTPYGRREGSADDLPPHARVMCQMMVAVANDDRDTAEALFQGFVGDDITRALVVVVIGLTLAGPCASDCGDRIQPGDQVRYVDDELMHVECADDTAQRVVAAERAEPSACPDCWLVHAGECM